MRHTSTRHQWNNEPRKLMTDINGIPSVSTQTACRPTAETVLFTVISIVAAIAFLAAVGIPLSLALTHTGPFSTRKSSTTTTITMANASTISTLNCSSYTTISDATRLTTYGTGTFCDSNLFTFNTTWVRFVAPGGTTIPTSTLSGNQCGANGAGWYAGTMPSSGQTVNGTVNFAFPGNSISISVTIQVRNCGSYYLYGLVTPNVCNYRYCTV